MAGTKGRLLPNLLLFIWIFVVGYSTYSHLNHSDFREEIKLLWQLQEVANNSALKDSIQRYVDIDLYLSNVIKAAEAPSIALVNENIIHEILADTTLDKVGKTQAILMHDLNKVIKLHYAEFKPDEKNDNFFGMHLRDRCTGDFWLKISFSKATDKKIDRLLVVEAR